MMVMDNPSILIAMGVKYDTENMEDYVGIQSTVAGAELRITIL